MPLETARLRLRSPRLADAPSLLRIFGDAEAQRHTLHFRTPREMRRHIAVHDRHRRKVGCGPWLVTEKATGAVVGWGGLYEDPLDTRFGIEVAYSFARSVWGKGYAGELVAFSLKHAREALGLPEVVAFCHPDNVASHRVLDKAGFVQERWIEDMQRHLYRKQLRAI
jgi:[ribosomal protein S5]-alanine N-acetyltransferase